MRHGNDSTARWMWLSILTSFSRVLRPHIYSPLVPLVALPPSRATDSSHIVCKTMDGMISVEVHFAFGPRCCRPLRTHQCAGQVLGAA